jgi:hypothetical protein
VPVCGGGERGLGFAWRSDGDVGGIERGWGWSRVWTNHVGASDRQYLDG